eukprot:942214-Amphidinium_carterae.1
MNSGCDRKAGSAYLQLARAHETKLSLVQFRGRPQVPPWAESSLRPWRQVVHHMSCFISSRNTSGHQQPS